MIMSEKLIFFMFLVVGFRVIEGQDEGRGRGDEIVEIERHIDFRELIRRHGRPRPRPRDIIDGKEPSLAVVPAEASDTVLRWLKLENVGDSGHTTNCGGSNLEVTWTPKEVSTSGSLSVSIDGTANADLSTAEITAKFTKGIFSKTVHQSITCDQMKAQYPTLNCPIKKGDSLSASTNIPSLSSFRLPTGKLEMEIKVNNEKGDEFACLKASVEIK